MTTINPPIPARREVRMPPQAIPDHFPAYAKAGAIPKKVRKKATPPKNGGKRNSKQTRTEKVDPQERPARWASSTQSREWKLYRACRAQLLQQVADAPSPAQAVLINRLALLQVHLAGMDEDMFRDHRLSDHAMKQYLAWHNTLTRGLKTLVGMKSPGKRVKTVAEVLKE